MEQNQASEATEELETPEQPEAEEPEQPESDEDQLARLFGEGDKEPEPEPDEEPEQEPEGPETEEADEEPETEESPETAEEQPERSEKPPDTGVSQEPEWFQKLPEDVRSSLVQQHQHSQHLYQSYRALQGRVPGLQRENSDLRKRLDEIEKAPTPTLEDLEKNDAYKEFAQDYPDEAKELKNVFTSQARGVQQAKEQANQLARRLEDMRRSQTQRETQRLASQHQDWMQVINSQPFQQWKSVIQANPQDYPEMAQKLSSPWAEDNVDVLNRFKKDYAEYTGASTEQPKEDPPKPRNKPTSRPKPPSPSPPSQGSGVSGNQGKAAPMSEEDEFARLVEADKRAKR